MKKPRVIIMVFTGEEPDRRMLESVAENIAARCMTDTVDHFVLGPDDIVKAIASTIPFNNVDALKETHSCLTAADNAAVFIGSLMKKELGKDYTPRLFMPALVGRINNAKKYPNNQLNREFMNALFILSQPDLNLSKAILAEKNLDEDKIAIIRDTYNFMQKYE